MPRPIWNRGRVVLPVRGSCRGITTPSTTVGGTTGGVTGRSMTSGATTGGVTTGGVTTGGVTTGGITTTGPTTGPGPPVLNVLVATTATVVALPITMPDTVVPAVGAPPLTVMLVASAPWALVSVTVQVAPVGMPERT